MIRLLGAGMIVLSSACVGFGAASGVRRQCAQLEGFLWALDAMKSEMSCRLTPLAELFGALGACPQPDVGAFFTAAGRELTTPPGCSLPVSFKRALNAAPELKIGQQGVQALYALAVNLGKFDLQAQLTAIDACAGRISAALKTLQEQKRARCRSYETIAICAGLALAVVLL